VRHDWFSGLCNANGGNLAGPSVNNADAGSITTQPSASLSRGACTVNVTIAVSVNDYHPIGADCATDRATDCILDCFHFSDSGLVWRPVLGADVRLGSFGFVSVIPWGSVCRFRCGFRCAFISMLGFADNAGIDLSATGKD